MKKDGNPIVVVCNGKVQKDNRGNFLKIHCFFCEITYRKQADKELKRSYNALHESEERFRALYENTTIGLYRTTPDGQILMANPALMNMLGYNTVEELKTRNLEMSGFESGYTRAVFKKKVEEQDEVRGLESAWKKKDDTTIYVRESAKTIKDANGNILYYEGTIEDITERKQLETKVQVLQKYESLSVMAGGIAHDFNNMLAGILGNAGLALMELQSDSPAYENLLNIQSIVQKATEVTNYMLAISGKGRFIIQTVNINDTIEMMRLVLEKNLKQNIKLKFNLGENLSIVKCDINQIKQMLICLVQNSAEAIGEKEGTITISTDTRFTNRDYLGSTHIDDDLPEGNYIYIEVEDDGCGMSEETLDKLFDPFFSTKFLGRGLGLPAVLGIVRGHKGAINVDSVPGKGTKITVLFPSSDLEVVKKEEKSEMVEFIPGRGTVLIIEDNEEVRKVVKNTIERFGYNVLLAANGKEGVKVFQDHTNTIDVILLDMTMPYLNGWETFLEIKKLNLRIPVLLTSGYSKDDVLKHFSGEKIFGFL